MAVYDQSYRVYGGATTAHWQRLLVIPRYGLRDLFRGRSFLAFFLTCLTAPLAAAALVYLANHLPVLSFLRIEQLAQKLQVGAAFFYHLLGLQAGFFATIAMIIAAPQLLSQDLYNNAIPLYLSRPLSRWEYLCGKLAVLAAVGSAITWIPCLAVYVLQVSQAEAAWRAANPGLGLAIFVGSWLWIGLFGIFSLAVCAAVKRRQVARGLLVLYLIVSASLGEAINAIYGTTAGDWIRLPRVAEAFWGALFHTQEAAGAPSLLGASTAGAVFLGASLLVLRKRLIACEVVR
ncbi:MAG: hypothetical protein HYV63_19500 [Candidatus Schekmanbacteria bacterium]|nr:hypothetical protein [Candidatus Schekmanbacteria bacterium]